MSYQHAPTIEGGTRDLGLRVPNWFVNFIAGPQENAKAKRRKGEDYDTQDHSAKITFTMSPDSWRFMAWVNFFVFVFFAMVVTEFITGPNLLAGPQPNADGTPNTCGPFNDGGPAISPRTGDGFDRTHGFDIKTQSHLNQLFGFNNICVQWDYSPSREATAVVYVLFEYALLLYIICDFLASALSYLKGRVSERYWKIARFLFPVQVFCCAMFRLIFVMIAYDNPRGHTFGFLMLQIAFMTVTILNTYHILDSSVSYDVLGGYKNTKKLAVAYLVGNVIISAFKTYFTCYIVFGLGLKGGSSFLNLGSPLYGGGNHLYPQWALTVHSFPFEWKAGDVVDKIWMFFNAILPLFISWFRSRNEPALVFTVDLEKVDFE